MSVKSRREKIKQIITQTEVNTQGELAKMLSEEGFSVTQATVSRDIKELGLIKVAGKVKKHTYAYEKKVTDVHDVKLLNLFKTCVVSIDLALNIVVVKTLGGNGNSAGVMIDKLKLNEVVGSVAGDDTVIIVTKTVEDAEKVKQKLCDLL